MRKAIVAGNWKMNGSTQSVASLVEEVVALHSDDAASDCELVLCPSELFITNVLSLLSNTSGIAIGGQNASSELSGAYTGEVSPQMLVEVGCKYVILGHSERRALFGETSAGIAKKFKVAQSVGLKPILCVGESLQEREDGVTMAVVEGQLSAVVDLCGVEALAESVIAYEPVWAIGTGVTATPEQAQEVHASIRHWVANLDPEVASNLRLLYGGSVKASNAAELFACEDIDGGLIGGASLNAKEFVAICRAAG